MRLQNMPTCKQCSSQFVVRQTDKAFYSKINVPEPTHCPQCRQQRRFAFRNERFLYSRNCDLCGVTAVSLFSPQYPGPVYCQTCWWSDQWDGTTYGRDYEPSRSFFEQFKELMLNSPVPALINTGSENSAFTTHSLQNKNCYLLISAGYNEDCYYGFQLFNSRDVVDGYYARESEIGYELIDVEKMYQARFCFKTQNCNDSAFLYDCNNCTNCFMSVNLRNKKFVFKNEQLTKEEYEKRISAIDFGSFKIVEQLKKEFKKMMAQQALHKYTNQIKCEECIGDHLLNCKNCYQCFDVRNSEDCAYGITAPMPLINSYDFNYSLGEHFFEVLSCVGGSNNYFIGYCWGKDGIEYSWYVMGSEQCFGCAGMNKKSYCILNKQYTKEEYSALRKRIIDDMRTRGEYGEFFPPSLSQYGFNETKGIELYPITKEQALALGFNWQDDLPGTTGKETLKPDGVPDSLRKVSEEITKEILACVECGKNYKIIAQELKLYKKIGTPIPLVCPNCRHIQRMNGHGTHVLRKRQCMCTRDGHEWHPAPLSAGQVTRCQNKFETVYSPERPEQVWCEPCYHKEIV